MRRKHKIFLDSGEVIKFKARSVEVHRNSFTGRIEKVAWTDADHPPLFLDLSHVIAVTS